MEVMYSPSLAPHLQMGDVHGTPSPLSTAGFSTASPQLYSYTTLLSSSTAASPACLSSVSPSYSPSNNFSASPSIPVDLFLHLLEDSLGLSPPVMKLNASSTTAATAFSSRECKKSLTRKKLSLGNEAQNSGSEDDASGGEEDSDERATPLLSSSLRSQEEQGQKEAEGGEPRSIPRRKSIQTLDLEEQGVLEDSSGTTVEVGGQNISANLLEISEKIHRISLDEDVDISLQVDGPCPAFPSTPMLCPRSPIAIILRRGKPDMLAPLNIAACEASQQQPLQNNADFNAANNCQNKYSNGSDSDSSEYGFHEKPRFDIQPNDHFVHTRSENGDDLVSIPASYIANINAINFHAGPNPSDDEDIERHRPNSAISAAANSESKLRRGNRLSSWPQVTDVLYHKLQKIIGLSSNIEE